MKNPKIELNKILYDEVTDNYVTPIDRMSDGQYICEVEDAMLGDNKSLKTYTHAELERIIIKG